MNRPSLPQTLLSPAFVPPVPLIDVPYAHGGTSPLAMTFSPSLVALARTRRFIIDPNMKIGEDDDTLDLKDVLNAQAMNAARVEPSRGSTYAFVALLALVWIATGIGTLVLMSVPAMALL